LGFNPLSTSGCLKKKKKMPATRKEGNPMLRTVELACSLPKADADALTAESGRVYTDMLVCHSRVYRKQGVWLAPTSGERLEDALGGPTTLHAHRRDAAQQGFYTACKTARACRKVGLEVKYSHRRKRWRTTIWKASKGIRAHAGTLLLGRARGVAPVQVPLPPNLHPLSEAAFLEVRLVWDRAARHYIWHMVIDDGTKPALPPSGDHTAAVDRGEIHPAALTDGKETVIITCRTLRANAQYTAKRRSELRAKQARKRKGSRAFRRLQWRKSRFVATQKRRAREMEHKISRAVVQWAKERQVSTLVFGDVGDVADGKRLTTKRQQKIGLWSHGRQRQYMTYKAEAAGMAVTLVEVAYTSQTCRARCPTGQAACSATNPKGASIDARLAVLLRIGTAWGAPICFPSTTRVSRGMCCLPKKSIVTPMWGSVVAWTRRIWLGFQPSGGMRPRSCGALAPAECHVKGWAGERH
jgi:putative transposase